MKKRVLSLILSISMLVGALSGCGSESTSALEDYLQDIADVSDDDDEAEDVKDEDSEQEAEASKEEAADGDDAVVSDEAYIERLEAYQEYYNSIKDEDEDYEVLAAISLDEDNLPIMWLEFVDKDELQRTNDDDNLFKRYYGFCDCVQVYGYEKKVVTILAETSRISDDFFAIAPTNKYLCLDLLEDGEDYIYYDKSIDAFTELAIDSDLCTSLKDMHPVYFGMGDDAVEEQIINGGELIPLVYCGYFYGDYDVYDNGFYCGDGTIVTAEREKEFAIFTMAAKGGRVPSILFEDSSDFNLRIENLIEEPIYDTIMLAIKCEYDKIYNVSYIDLDNKDKVDELFEYLVNRRCENWGYSYDEVIEDINQEYGLNLE